MATTKIAKKIYPIKTFISDLPTSHILKQASPSASDNAARPAHGRLVIIGDIHGMRKSLSSLLDKVNFSQQNGDHLILVGDLINKGPDSAGVVDLAIKLGASAVRGNHENAVLHAAGQISAKGDYLVQAGVLRSASTVRGDRDSDPSQTTPEHAQNPNSGPDFELIGDMENFQKHMAANAGPDDVQHGSATYTTALKLSKVQLEWLASLPLILRVELPGDIPSPFGENLIVVHAGLVPNVPLEKQEPHSIMHMRSLNRASSEGDAITEFLPTEDFGEEGWIKEWDLWQESQESKTTVVFGHDAKRRLQVVSVPQPVAEKESGQAGTQ
ncbi:unnamed protein product [Penicillium pancosmium]